MNKGREGNEKIKSRPRYLHRLSFPSNRESMGFTLNHASYGFPFSRERHAYRHVSCTRALSPLFFLTCSSLPVLPYLFFLTCSSLPVLPWRPSRFRFSNALENRRHALSTPDAQA